MKKTTCLLLALALLLCCGACGKTEKAPAAAKPAEAPAAAADAGTTYSDSYTRYWTLYGAMLDEVNRRVESNNTAVKAADPENYLTNAGYLSLLYVPFGTVCPSMGSTISGSDLSKAEEMMGSIWNDLKLRESSEGVYEADYTYSYTDAATGAAVQHSGHAVWEFSKATGAFRVTNEVDGAQTEFTEYVPLGEDTWLLYTMADKALVTYKDGKVESLFHTHRISEPALGSFPGDVRYCSLAEDDFYPAAGKSIEELRAWITGDEDAQYTITIENDEMTFAGKNAEDITVSGEKAGVSWTDIPAFTLIK